MNVEKVRIQNFLSIKDSGEIEIGKNIICLLGKNESGKTNFLKALESFNKDYDYLEDDLCSYSEAKERLESDDIEAEDIEMVTIWFKIDKNDKKKLKQLNKKFAMINNLKITKKFNNKYEINTTTGDDIENLEIEINDIIKQLKSKINILSKSLEKHAKKQKLFSVSLEQYKNGVKKFLAIDFNVNNIESSFDDFFNELENLPERNEEIDLDIDDCVNALGDIKNELTDIVQINIKDEILKLIPNLVYFSNIGRLTDDIKIDEFISNKEKYKTLNNLMSLAGLNVEKLKEKSKHQRRSSTEGASTRITGLVNESWTQETVRVKIGADGEDIIIFIEDKTGALDKPSKRSQGFQWFLGFYINFMAGSKEEFKNTVLLLDDPGVYLHPSGQKDLLKTLEKLSKNNQIIYTTHSPFLIDKWNLDRVKIIKKKIDGIGTIVKEKFHDSDFDALEPIRAAIGATIGDSLFGNKKNIIVEGYSDYLIFEGISNYFNRTGRETLNLSEVAIIPAGGATKTPYFTLIVWKEGYKFVIVLDNDSNGRKIKKELIEKYPIEESLIIKLDEILPEKREGMDIEIEDFIDISFYNIAVNEAYKDLITHKIKLDKLDKSKNSQIKKYKDFFKKKRLGKFDKIIVAKQIRNMTSDKSCDDKSLGNTTIKNFEKLFKFINERLE